METYIPDRESFCRIAEAGNIAPVFRELPADLDTPVSVFLKLKGNTPCFLLESVERGEQVGRYSFIGTNPSVIVRANEKEAVVTRNGSEAREFLGKAPKASDPLHVVQRLLSGYRVVRLPGLPGFFGGAVGYLSYDMVRFFERLPNAARDELNLPDCFFMFTDTMVIFDHVQQKMKVVCNVPVGGDPARAYDEATARIDAIVFNLEKPLAAESLRSRISAIKGRASEVASNFTPAEFKQAVRAAKEYIAAGDAFQIVVSQRLRQPTTADPFSVYRTLRMLNPSPYMFYLECGGFQVVGSSPEMLVRLEEGVAETRPIAGTRPRGSTAEEDAALSESLLADPKERAEHVMLVDLGRNDLGRVCRFGTVRVPTSMVLEKYSHVIHIVSSVKGELAPDQDAFSLLRACFPAGTLTGAPKVRAMEIINELEGLRRGPYGGAVGYFSFTGNMDTCITIRTIVIKDGIAYMQGGAGIVADSDPDYEYRETMKKTEVLRNALAIAEANGTLGRNR
ncbi:MAG: anthranilate synthase component I [Chloroflexi bacterium]|nr:anthranilate synthase component I [Chloroflexota bacterium]